LEQQKQHREFIMVKHTYSTIAKVIVLAAMAASLRPTTAGAEDYLGAAAVLQQLMSTNGATSSDVTNISPAEQLRADLKTFSAQSADLPPSVAASTWLALLDRQAQLAENPTVRRLGQVMPLQFAEVLEVLPAPAAWPELARQVDARAVGDATEANRQLGLRLLVHTLTGDDSRRSDDLAALEQAANKAKTSQAYVYINLFDQLNRSLLARMNSPEAIIQSLERKLAAQAQQEYGSSSLEIPDLVAIAGPGPAEDFLRKALVQSKCELSIDADTATCRLAQQLALKLINDLKAPQWSLVNSLAGVELYEAMEKRFTPTAPAAAAPAMPGLPGLALQAPPVNDYERQNAKIYYFLGLIAQGRTTNAIVVAKEFEREDIINWPDAIFRQMERAGFTVELNHFFHDLLQQSPELPFWDEYVQVAAHAGDAATMVDLVQTTAGQSSLSRKQRTQLHQLLYKALLANDEVDAGTDKLRELMNESTNPPAAQGMYNVESRTDLALKLARIGQLLNRTNLVEEGLSVARSTLAQGNNVAGNLAVLNLAAFLQEIGRGPEAEKVLIQALKAGDSMDNSEESYGGGVSTGPKAELLAALVRLYHEAGRYQDILTLADQAPFWGAKDLAQVGVNYRGTENWHLDYSFEHVATPLGFYVADALAKTSRSAEARAMLMDLFVQSPGCDRLYELLLDLEDTNAPAILDAIFARDQFEERPLIWKAHWYREHQRLEEAEAMARKAISIDPTDGAEGPGDRLRAYAELAEIRAVRGDAKEAEGLRGAVQAVRQAELADKFHAVDLLKHAIDLYTDSLNRFADAYCIHARLAVQLSDLGRHEEAAEHYRRAYELMPDSFGRVESHCFGCERAFDGERAQGIAEQVFLQLANKTPDKPQVHYLLGYLRDEESRYQEALESYRTAVKLDGDYLNAWSKLLAIDQHVFLPSAERDNAVANVLRLDPQSHHCQPSFELISNLPALWNEVAAAERLQPVLATNLYPLAASAAALAKANSEKNDSRRQAAQYYRQQVSERREARAPSQAISENGFVRAAATLIGNQSGIDDDF
jgi:tetratricopeptide (TPR) repeat protein